MFMENPANKLMDVRFLLRLIYRISGAVILLFLYSLFALSFVPEKSVTESILFYMIYRLVFFIPVATAGIFILVKKFTFAFFEEIESDLKGFSNKCFFSFSLAVFSLLPIFRYVIANEKLFLLADIACFILVCLSISILFILFVPLLFLKAKLFKTAAVAGSGFLFVLYSIASKHQMFMSIETFEVSSLCFIPFIGMMVFLTLVTEAKYREYILLCMFTLVLVFAFSKKCLMDKQVQAEYVSYMKEKNFLSISETKLKHTPDIFLLVFDGYMDHETSKRYGKDNKKQLDFLKNNGFKIYENTHSVGYCTLSSMDRVFSLSPSTPERTGISGGGIVTKILSDNGYYTSGIFRYGYMLWNLGKKDIHYDEHFPFVEHYKENFRRTGFSKYMLKSILSGSFTDEAMEFETVFDDSGDTKKTTFLEKKNEFLTKKTPKNPVFLYLHTFPNHARSSNKDEDFRKKRYIRDFEKANEEMKITLEQIFTGYQDPLIIIMGDHGNWLSNRMNKALRYSDSVAPESISKEDLKDAYSSFLAIRWPKRLKQNEETPIRIIQDIFPVIFTALSENSGFMDMVMPDRTVKEFVKGVRITDGIIEGGKDSGFPLFD